jgi:hypothetical protein
MRKIIFIAIAVLILAAGCLLFAQAAAPTTSWRTVEDRIPQAFSQTDLHVVQSSTEGSDRVALPLGLRIRQSLFPNPPVHFGFPESVLDYTVETPRGFRLHCLVRYTGGKVARIVVEYPKPARKDAESLRDALRHVFPADRVSLDETTAI